MKLSINLLIAVFFILAAVKTSQSQEDYTISGKVRYSDNNEVVTSGMVRLVDLTGITVGTATIGNEGDYILGPHRLYGDFDLIGFPNIEPEMDFVPTGYPNQINPQQFTHVFVNSNLTGIDIYVLRIPVYPRPNQELLNVNGKVLNNGNAVKDAIVYAKQGEDYLGFGVSNSLGEFTINSLPQGDYILVAHKVGNESDSKEIELGEGNMDNIVLNVIPKAGVIVNNNPFEFSLSQNYPNPFNPGTVIRYSISKSGPVSLKVYDNLGREVEALVSGNKEAGTYSAEFNAAKLSSGIYFYRLESAGLVSTRKMILVK